MSDASPTAAEARPSRTETALSESERPRRRRAVASPSADGRPSAPLHVPRSPEMRRGAPAPGGVLDVDRLAGRPRAGARRSAARLGDAGARRPLLIIGARERPAKPRKILVAVAWPYASGLGTSATSRASAFRRTRSPATTGCAGTTCSWSAERTSTARRSWSPRTPRASRRVRPLIGSASSSAKTSAISACPTTSSRARRRGTTTASRRISSGRSTRRATSSNARRSGRSPPRRATRFPTATSRARVRSAASSARGDQCDNCGNQLDPTDLIEPAVQDRRNAARLRDDEASVPRPAGVQGPARRVDRKARRLAAERPALLAQLRRRSSSRARSRVTSTGASDSRFAGYDEPRRQADLRLVRRGHRLPLGLDRVGGEPWHAGCVARLVAEPGRRAHVLHGEGQHRLPHGDLAEHAARLRRGRGRTVRGGATSSSRQRRLERVPDDGRQAVQSSRGVQILVRDFLSRTTWTRCATSSRSPG